MYFDVNTRSKKSTRDGTLIELLKSPTIMAFGISTLLPSSAPTELCDRLNILLQEKQAENNSVIIKEETIAIVDKLLEYKCISTKQQKQHLN